MIGLGSNRLSVCRRGGMSVTQAGRGGMEWLAGGRLPIWSQWWLPYSRQAGEALKAQFPTQWATIRDYGFAHPEIVGYMNAYAPEDAKIAYSLCPLDKIRAIVLDGSAYAWTRYKANQKTFMSFQGTVATTKTGGGEKWHTLFACDNSVSSNSFGIWANDTAAGGTLLEWDGQWAGGYATIALNRRFYAEINKNVTTVKYIDNDQTIISKTNSAATFETPSNVGLFMLIRGSGPISGYDGYLVGTCERVMSKQDGVLSEDYIPFKRNGVMELLDLVSGNLATRVGTFTELIGSPS